MMNAFPIVVLISGNGSNLQAIINSIENHKLPVVITAVISNREDAYGLIRARTHHIPTEVISSTVYTKREAYDFHLLTALERYQPQLIVLAGFMRILSANFVHHYYGKIINLHPSLLPKYPGLNTHQQVINNNDKEHGASVHFVSAELDSGPIICQAKFLVEENDTVTGLKEKVQKLEHQMYPQVIEWYAKEELYLLDDKVIFQGNPLPAQGLQLQI